MPFKSKKQEKALSKAKMSKLPRFTPNPEAHWGPGIRAGGKVAAKRKRFLSAPQPEAQPKAQKTEEQEKKKEDKKE